MAPSMVAPSWSDLWPSTGAQQHEIVRPDDSFFLTRITAPAHPPQHYTCTPCPSSARAPLHARDGLQGVKHRDFAGEGTRRVHLLDLAKYILRNIPQFLILRLLAAEAARLFLLPALDAASAPLTTSSPLEVVSRASEARRQVDSRAGKHHALTAFTAETQRQPISRADLVAKQPRRRGKRGSGACRKAGKHLAES